ncbi:hypothetical protein [Paenibacillus sp. L3-i20]|uniref:phage adaptor protein n=1 Tax=Paenibacillus sp. L3-i20 TaxID=2905833 RepID=UPI001EE10F8A|nr:hypothetical protein [Paenibacillus sp. L3-i20]GKU76845.1 hypothetical protein L3i20_v212420 [Paenibacillus sp. L3-i20]
MLLSEAVEEILEKAPNHLSMQSIIRKINISRDQLLRRFGRETDVYQINLIEGESMYPWALPKGGIQSVTVNGKNYPFSYDNDISRSRYYYFLSGLIGLHPTPTECVIGGMTIFYDKTLSPLTVEDLDQEIGFDRDYDMLVVYGALKTMEISNASMYYSNLYNQLLDDYLAVNTEPEHYQIKLEGW